jgi:hypothetical protein
MKITTASKYRRASKAKFYDAFIDESPSRDCLRRSRMDDDGYMLLLDKFVVWRADYETVASRFDAVYDRLIDDAEYLPEDLVCGVPIYGGAGIHVGEIDVLLCLKHMASLPEARIVEVKSGIFMLAH